MSDSRIMLKLLTNKKKTVNLLSDATNFIFLFMFHTLYKTSVCFYSEGRGACLLLLCECVAASPSVCV